MMERGLDIARSTFPARLVMAFIASCFGPLLAWLIVLVFAEGQPKAHWFVACSATLFGITFISTIRGVRVTRGEVLVRWGLRVRAIRMEDLDRIEEVGYVTYGPAWRMGKVWLVVKKDANRGLGHETRFKVSVSFSSSGRQAKDLLEAIPESFRERIACRTLEAIGEDGSVLLWASARDNCPVLRK